MPSSGNVVVQSRNSPFLDSCKSMVADDSWLTFLFYTVLGTHVQQQSSFLSQNFKLSIQSKITWPICIPILSIILKQSKGTTVMSMWIKRFKIFWRLKEYTISTLVYTPQQNGVAEQKNHSLIEMVYCLCLMLEWKRSIGQMLYYGLTILRIDFPVPVWRVHLMSSSGTRSLMVLTSEYLVQKHSAWLQSKSAGIWTIEHERDSWLDMVITSKVIDCCTSTLELYGIVI